ncbi:MAG: hypothetical protein HUJ71_01240 [Pseudobutyrivibrio sp.]|nr:hypothetical protein [Pseudobutyrivibrio sp.]
MKLYKEEIKKTFKTRLSLGVILLIILIQVCAVVASYSKLRDNCKDVKKYNEYANAYNGTLDESMVDVNDIRLMENDFYHRKDDTVEDYFYQQYLASICRAKQVEKIGDNVNIPKYYNAIGINCMAQNLTSTVTSFFVLVGIIFIVLPVYSKDRENGMDYIIYTSYLGRKEICKVKLWAAYVLVGLWVTIYYLFSFMLYVGVFDCYDMLTIPINSIGCLLLCPLRINVLEYFILGYVLLLISSFAYTSVMLFVYARVNYTVFCIGAGVLLIILPMFLPKNGILGRVTCILPSVFGKADLIIGNAVSINIFGHEVLLAYFGAVVLLTATMMINLVYKKTFWIGRVDL